MTITFLPFTEDNIYASTRLMERAFNEDSMMHRGVNDGPTGYNDGSFLRRYALNPDADAYIIMGDGKQIGVTVLWIDREHNENFLGCLFTDPELHSRGIGTIIWRKIEEMYPDTVIWRTETPLCSIRNLNFYINKCGFMAYKIDDPENRDEAIVKLIKYTDNFMSKGV